MTALGVVYLPQLPPEQLRSAVRTADEVGLDQLWLWEDCFLESGIAAAAAALAWSERLTVGIGVLPVPLRNVALTAMEIATVSRLFPGRFTVGVGHGVQSWMAQVGEKVASPMTLLREQLTALRSLLDGRTVTVDGRYVQLDGVSLDWPPLQRQRLLSAATGAKTLALSGELADGTVLTGGSTPDQVSAARAVLDANAPGDHEVIVYLLCATGEDALERVSAEAAAAGHGDVQDCAVYGTAEQIAVGIARWTAAGADTVVLQPTRDATDIDAFVRFVATRVAPLVG